MYSTYILKSISTSKLYIGHTSTIIERIVRHNSGREKYTKKYKPYKLIFKKQFNTKAEAYRFELELKSIKNKRYLLKALRDRSSIG